MEFVLEYENLLGERLPATPPMLLSPDRETGAEAARVLTSPIPLYLDPSGKVQQRHVARSYEETA